MTAVHHMGRLLFLLLASAGSLADEHHTSHETLSWQEYGPHHLSLILGGTEVSDEGTAETIGIDYEYRLNDYVGIGAVFEHAAGEINANTSLAVTDLHPFHNGFIVQLGLGIETRTSEELDDILVARAGMLYEFEYGRYTLSPQLHWDYHDEHPNAIVFAIAFGAAF